MSWSVGALEGWLCVVTLLIIRRSRPCCILCTKGDKRGRKCQVDEWGWWTVEISLPGHLTRNPLIKLQTVNKVYYKSLLRTNLQRGADELEAHQNVCEVGERGSQGVQHQTFKMKKSEWYACYLTKAWKTSSVKGRAVSDSLDCRGSWHVSHPMPQLVSERYCRVHTTERPNLCHGKLQDHRAT